MKSLLLLESSFQQAIGIDNASAHSYSTNASELNISSSTNTTSGYRTMGYGLDDGHNPPPITAITYDGGYHTTALSDDGCCHHGGGGVPTTAIFDNGGYPPPLPPPDEYDPYNWIPGINRYGNATNKNIRNLMGMLWQTQYYQLPNTRYTTDV